MEKEFKYNPTETEKKEKVVTVIDVLNYFAAALFFVCLFTAALSIIWMAWPLLRLCLTIIVVELAWWSLAEYISAKISRK